MSNILVEGWEDYRLLDSGGGEKLEQFGSWVLRRPEPQAIWPKGLQEEEWQQRADAVFTRSKGSSEAGSWSKRPGMKDPWFCSYRRNGLNLRYKLALSSFKHVGVFPEQSSNWDFLARKLPQIRENCGEAPRVLNLFGYTGIASLAACSLDAKVTHVDAVRQVLSWGRESMQESGLDGIRWLADDALKFVRREERRGNSYHCIILDPPAYGRGPDGEKWLLEEQIGELLDICSRLILKKNYCVILNMYSMGYTAVVAENLCKSHFSWIQMDSGELHMADISGRKLPLGIFCRFSD